MTTQQLNKFLGNIDLYLLDQVLKNKISQDAKVLDAGCGEGRNLIYFLNNQFEVYGIDQNEDAIRMLQFIVGSGYPLCPKDHFQIGELSALPFQTNQFDYVICSAVLHFAQSTHHFWQMFTELDRVLTPNGTLFIRMTSDIGLNGHETLEDGRYHLPDGSQRFLLTEEMIQTILNDYGYSKSEAIKTVIVANQRCMTTLVLKKN
ncbi:class I SAM-dependent methyltransferase [Reichenbachiella carrageenanivorans]|uniref:Class I SAM-dependent methyltransferase n=1 Tax=Reichenbachiella carrageenanivorans TaxID=2979869 RepID=A0ABY6D0A0_9BACT|nr:class I SAM-dependent methyltransferase [Reichenbachiella carrageenanivorans]UXX79344.1 class I SAM-dependent methyltransferase [Reichenbachiella carrageenanivorans]